MFFEFAAEILLEIYMELMLLIVPDKKLKKWQITLSKVIAIVVIIGVFALVLWGLTLLGDRGNPMGYVPITAAAVISLTQIIAGILLYKKHHKD